MGEANQGKRKWELKTPQDAETKKAEAAKRYDETQTKLETKWGNTRWTRELDLTDFAAAMEEEDTDVGHRSLQKSTCGYSFCMDSPAMYVCALFCCDMYRRHLEQHDVERKTMTSELCSFKTNIKDFLRKFPTDSVKECVTEETLCELTHPCGYRGSDIIVIYS
eukprot:scaffold34922_cov141-Amphora_coffeaeformis.AAC.10